MENRCCAHLQAAQEASLQRDKLLSAVASIVEDRETTEAHIDTIDSVKISHLHKMHEQAATVTRCIGGTALLAEKASKQVKRLDFLLSRVCETREISEALLQQKKNITTISSAIEANDLASATECVQKYEEAKRLLTERMAKCGSSAAVPLQARRAVHISLLGGSSSVPAREGEDSVGSDVVMVDRESLMESAKSEVSKMLRSQLSSAVALNDKLKIVKLTSMLCSLGFTDEACEAYNSWICDHTIAQLRTMVSRELRNMDDPTAVGVSHLTLVSNALDHVAAAVEQEQQHVLDTFGPAGHLQFLHLLHSRCTQHCTPVVRDFLEKRRVLSRAHGRSGSAVENPNLSSPSNRPPAVAKPDPRKIDEMLEEISHLVSCCHLYMTFMDGEMAKAAQKCSHTVHQQPNNDSRRHQQYSVLATKDNALFDTIQELLSIYIPMQVEYFEAALQQAIKIQDQQLAHAASKAAKGHSGNSSSATQSQATSSGFMGALSSLYGAAESNPAAVDEMLLHHDANISLVDDVFYFLRIAIHRAVGTKSTSILSAVIIATVELIQTRLLQEISNHMTQHIKKLQSNVASNAAGPSSALEASHSHHLSLSPKALKWLTAAHHCKEYTSKIGDELHHLVVSSFTQPDELVRFSEQRHDIDLTAKMINEKLEEWIQRLASAMSAHWLSKASARFLQCSYVLTEDQFFHLDLADPWAQNAIASWGHSLEFIEGYLLSEDLRDQLVHAICSKVTKGLEEAILQKKQFNAFGALQLDKDVRHVRQFFMDRTERPIRDIFSRLHAVMTLLLVDRPQEAAAVLLPASTDDPKGSKPLSTEEKRRVLLMRVDFDPQVVAAVSL